MTCLITMFKGEPCLLVKCYMKGLDKSYNPRNKRQCSERVQKMLKQDGTEGRVGAAAASITRKDLHNQGN